MREIVVVAHNLRSCHNIGSLLRTAEGLGIVRVYLTGYTPYPLAKDDTRLPHVSTKVAKQIHKTALGAENTQTWEYREDVQGVIADLQEKGFLLAAIEQAPDSIPLQTFRAPQKTALFLGREVEGIEPDILRILDVVLEIPMYGEKESFNVVQAAAMGLYQCRFMSMT